MLSFMSAKEAAEKWNISQRRVSILCNENRIAGAMMVGNMWIIPETAEKPADKRTTRYEKFTTVELRPFVKWVGGKSQLIPDIENILKEEGEQRFKKYAEPMVGGGAMLFRVLSRYDFEEFYISDINAELINAYQVIKNDVEGLIDKLAEIQKTFFSMTESERKYFYYAVRDKFNGISLTAANATEKATYFIFLNRTCFNGLYRVNKKGEFNVPVGTYRNPTICDAGNLRNIGKSLEKVTIECADYSLSQQFIDKNTFVYLDPPYRPISATSAFTAYNAETFDDGEQIRLAQFINEINKTGAKIVLSNSDPQNTDAEDTFFEDLYKKYKIQKIDAKRMINSNAEKRGKIKELLISN